MTIEELEFSNDVPSPERRFAVLLDQPNGTTALLFDDTRGAHADPDYMRLLHLLKRMGDPYDRAGELTALAIRMSDGDDSTLIASLVYPGVAADDLYDDDLTLVFNGDKWDIDSVIKTDIPIVS